MEDGIIGLFLGAFITLIIALILVDVYSQTHDVGMTQRACMVVANNPAKSFTACISGEDLFKLLRQREGIKE
jgi:hypothetical protein